MKSGFSDNLWDGNGKEYFLNGNVLFSGEYYRGRKWNGKGYDNKFGNVQFILEDGNGRVREYNYDGELIFEGKYKNGKRDGYGIIYPEGEGVYYKSRNTYINDTVYNDNSDYIDSD